MELNDKYINQFTYIQSVINSAEEIMHVIRRPELVTDQAGDTIYLVVEYTKKQVKLLPELIFLGANSEKPKEKMIEALKDVSDIWLDPHRTGNQLETAWNGFVFWWKRYYEQYARHAENGNAIIISLN